MHTRMRDMEDEMGEMVSKEKGSARIERDGKQRRNGLKGDGDAGKQRNC